ncbi:MAG: relaxase/mobilization nuclease domain-containing protein [Acidobacteria bacterium]|nr:relaxase/mobilization nuclease domain-containing protein [Acidobacteriota bacterium]
MHLKFLARGRGAARVAAAYLLGKLDAAGKERASVEVLRGDPNQVAAVADGLSFEHRYTSGLIAWSPDDTPTAAQVERVVDAFEKTAWAGLAPDRYAWSAVLHRDRGSGVHVHVFAARCDLATGRSLNIAPPGWQKTFDPLRDAFNYEHGWSRPDDPARARASRPSPPRAYRDAAALRAGLEVEPDPRELIEEHLRERVASGVTRDRAGVVAALRAFGLEVTRQGRHYVTVRRPETGERWRLKGGLYEEDFDRDRFMRQQGVASGDRPRAAGGNDAAQAEALWQEVEATRLRRAEYHQTRYGGGGAARGRTASGDGDRAVGPAAAEPAGRGAAPESLGGHLRRELGGDAMVVAGNAVAARVSPTPQREAELLATPTGAALLRELGRREERIREGAGSDRPIVDAIEEQSESGVSEDGGVAQRAQVIDRARDLLEEDRAELEREEAALLEEAAGEELIRGARLEVLGNADREAQSLVEREAVIDKAAAAAERRRRQDRVLRLLAAPGGDDLLLAALDEHRPQWRQQAKLPAVGIDLALDAAESGRRKPVLQRHQLILEAEASFPDAPAAAWREAGAGVDRTGATGRYAGSVLHQLAGRAHVRALVAEQPARPAPPGLVKRVIGWVRERVGRLLSRLRPSKPAQRPDHSGSAGVERERAAAAKREQRERTRARQLITAAEAAARKWGGVLPATDTIVSVAESIGARPETPAGQRAVLDRIDWDTAPPRTLSTEDAGLRRRWRDEKEAAADQRHQQALGEWKALSWGRRRITRKPERERPGLPSRQELAVARAELVGVVRAAMLAELERVAPSPASAHRDEPAAPSMPPPGRGQVERPAEGQRPLRTPARDWDTPPEPSPSRPRRPRSPDRGHDPGLDR